MQSAILLPVAILKFSTSCLHTILIMRHAVSCDITNRQTGVVKVATSEEIKLLVMSKDLAIYVSDGSHRNLKAHSLSLEELLFIETGLTVCSHMKFA